MAESRWTVVVVPRGSGVSKSIGISKFGLKVAASVFALVLLAGSAITYIAVTKSIDISRLDRLQETNSLLAQELDRAETVVATLGDTIAAITDRNRQIRLLAGLEATDPAVLQAGVGGPADPSPEDESLAESLLGNRSLDMREALDGLVRRASILSASFQQAEDSLTAHVERLRRTPSLRPITSALSWFTSGFRRDRVHPIHGEARAHEGIDISADMNTPIIASAAGTVIDAGWVPGYGQLVTIDHGFGVVTKYAHASRILVRVGQRVERNEEVALVGSSGISTGPHLHYEVIVDGKNIDPWNYIIPDEVVD
ncbi:MAG: M23 family metallopeptidase [Gemmatimonadetes bacterium]|nr:M23 family metallopeptidase [Gemmatimonadota bacterium]